MPRVRFYPTGEEVEAPLGRTLLQLAKEAGLVLPSTCGGDGICGRCRVVVRKGRVLAPPTTLLSRDEVQAGYVLACQTQPLDDLEVWVPEAQEALAQFDLDAQRFRALAQAVDTWARFPLQPLVTKVFLEIPPPTLGDNLADQERVYRELGKALAAVDLQMGLKVLTGLPQLLRESGWKATFTVGHRAATTEVIQVEPGDCTRHNLGVAVDVGTSTVVVHLVDLVSGRTLDAEACYNAQATYGAEVTRRMIYAQKEGVRPLQEAVVGDINRMIGNVVARNGLHLRDVTAVMAAGNTAMLHFLLGLDPGSIRKTPYVPVATQPPAVRAVEVGIHVNPRALLYCMPAIGGWVGGDITAGILATGLHRSRELSLLMDIGTNGEIVLGNKDWMVTCSTSAGPAFEGSGVRCGMRAAQGAVERVHITPSGHLLLEIIGGGLPRGLCGSGLVDAVAELYRMGYVDRTGRLRPEASPRIRGTNGLEEFLLVPKDRAAHGQDIVVTQADIENLLRAKAAIYAGAKILLGSFALRWEDLDRVWIAGGFGNYLDPDKAITLGLLPDIPREKVQFVGNTAILGAKMGLLSKPAFEEASAIARKATYFDLITESRYYEEFMAAKFIPHTDVRAFSQQGTRK